MAADQINLISETDLARKTGRSRSWILTRFADVSRHDGKITVDDALRCLAKPGGTGDLTEAKIRESNARAEKVEIEVENLQKTRIPIEVVNELLGAVLAETKAIIQQSGLDATSKKHIFAELRSIPERLKW